MCFFKIYWELSKIDLNKIKNENQKEFIKIQNKIYEKFIEDLEFSFFNEWKSYKKILFKLPREHFYWFIKMLKKIKDKSILKYSQIWIVVFDHLKIWEVKDIKKEFEKYLNYIYTENFDKIINISTNSKNLFMYVKNKKKQNKIKEW